MRVLNTVKDSANYPRLKQSLDYQFRKKQLTVSSIIAGAYLVFAILFTCIGSSRRGTEFALFQGLVLSLVALGYWIYTVYELAELFFHINSYHFFEARLDQPHIESGRYSSHARFTVTFQDRSGNQLSRATAAMFSSDRKPFFEDYNNQTVLLGYNKESDLLVVLHRVT